MDTNRLHFDTLDLLVASVAIVTTLWLLPTDAGHGTERFAVGVAVIGLVGAKRFVWPTPPANEDAPALLRMAYLFIALVGTACVGLGLLVRFGDLAEFQAPAAMDPATAVTVLLGLGCACLLVAVVIDRTWLKRAANG